MESKFTPGPWVYKGYCIYPKIKNADAIVQLYRPHENANHKADANLIAAAPDMYEALEKLKSIYFDMSRTTFDLLEIRSIVENALKKARGLK